MGEIAAGIAPEEMDGLSLLSHLQGKHDEDVIKRESFIISHQGIIREGDLYGFETNPCYLKGQYDFDMFWCQEEYDCRCQDSINNTFSCVRTLSQSQNDLYCQFDDDVNFVELYDLNTDPYQMYNLAPTLDEFSLQSYEDKLNKLLACSGKSCKMESNFAATLNSVNLAMIFLTFIVCIQI